MHTFIACSDRVEIDAPQQLVWNILYDVRHYPEWNPFTERVITDFKPGSAVELHVHLPRRGTRLQREFITLLKPPTQMEWSMHMISEHWLKARRLQTIDIISPERCCYHTEDHISGLLAPLVRWLFRQSMIDGFNAMAYALKQKAEADYRRITQRDNAKAYS